MDQEKPYVDEDCIAALWQSALSTFVQQEEGKVLSDRNFSSEFALKLAGLTNVYSELTGLPAINGVSLKGNNTLFSLGLTESVHQILSAYKAPQTSHETENYNDTYFNAGTKVSWVNVGHVVTMRITIVVKAAIPNDTPIEILKEKVIPAFDDGYTHLGRYVDASSHEFEFAVSGPGVLTITNKGSELSEGVYHISSTYIGKDIPQEEPPIVEPPTEPEESTPDTNTEEVDSVEDIPVDEAEMEFPKEDMIETE